MWISKQMLKKENTKNYTVGEISESFGDNVSVLGENEHKGVKITAPYGVYYKIPLSKACVMLDNDKGSLLVGAVMDNKTLNSGELYLSVKDNTGILLKPNGDIEINGTVKINGVIQ